MGLVLVQGAVIKCLHGGQLKLLTGSTSLVVGQNGAVTSGMEAGLTFGSPQVSVPGMVSPCNATTTTSPPAPAPCVTGAGLPASLATKLTVGNLPVLLDSASGLTTGLAAPSLPGTWSVADAGQQKLEAL
jgi:hypothetical protein